MECPTLDAGGVAAEAAVQKINRLQGYFEVRVWVATVGTNLYLHKGVKEVEQGAKYTGWGAQSSPGHRSG